MRTGTFLPFALTIVLLGMALVSGQEQAEKPFPRELVQWEPIEANPLFHGAGGQAWDAKIRERGWIRIGSDGRWRLWYTDYNWERQERMLLGYATSPDGIHWTRDRRNPIFTESWVEDMCVVRHQGAFFMFAEGRHDDVHLLTADDGLHWTEQGPLDIRLTTGKPIPPGPRGTPTVLIRDGVWSLFYERRDRGIWLATSTDCETWTNVRDEPVIPCGPAAYDRSAIALNQVIGYEGSFYGLYHAQAEEGEEWTTCLARSDDLIHWEKYSGNPIVQNNSSSGIFVPSEKGPILYTMHPEVRRYRNPEEDATAEGG